MSKIKTKFIENFKLASLIDVDEASIATALNNYALLFNSSNSLWEAKNLPILYSHPNHTGEITSVGDGAQVLDKSAIENKPTTEIDDGDFILFSDTSDAGNLKKFNFTFLATEVYETIWAEESGGLGNGQREWSFGNGATGNINIPIFYDCKIREIGIDAEVVGTSIILQVMVNNVAVAQGSIIGEGIAVLDVEVTVNKGDFLGFRTLSRVGTYTDARVAVALIQEIKAIRGAKGETGAGSNILVRQDNILIGVVTDALNFEGNIVNVSDEGASQTKVEINETITTLTETSSGVFEYVSEDGTAEIIDISDFETSSELNARDTANRSRANHTGTQLASTISDFETAHDSLPSDNPHSVTKAQVGLGNADNVSDANKPVSIATAQAISDAISNLIDGAPVTLDTLNELAQAINDDENFATTITTQLSNHVGDFFNPHQVTKAQVGLGNADNVADIDKIISTLTQNALDGKQNINTLLTAISALASNGIIVRTGAGASVVRTITGTAGNIDVVNGDGVSGNPTLNLPNVNTAGSVGSASQSLSITTDTKGRVTSRTAQAISIVSSQVTNFASTVRATVLTGISFVSGATVLATDTILVAIGKLQQQITLLVFGDEFQFAEELTTTTTTSGSYIQKMRLTTTNLPTGQYVIMWSADGGATDKDSGIYQLEENDTTVITENEARMNMPSGVVWYNSFSGHAIRNLSGVNTYDIDYKETGGTASIRNARLTLWRVS